MSQLTGYKVIDLTHMVAGPLATMLLADLGADVLKIEPAHGDTSRHLGDPIAGADTDYFIAYNRNKRSIVLDLKAADDLATLRALIADADIVVENFRAGTMDRLGLGYERLRAANPRLIYCSITGYGPDSPAAHRPAVDPVMQALSGLMSLTGTPQSGPLKTGFPLGDYVTPLFATIGILAAVVERQASGVGRRVDVAMLDALVFTMLPREGAFFAHGRAPVLRGNAHGQMVPANSYDTADGRQIYVFVHNDKFWRILVDLLGDAELGDVRFATNAQRLQHRAEIDGRIATAFRAHPLDHWEPRIDAMGAPAGTVRTLPEVFADPLVRDEMVATLRHRSGDIVHLLKTPIAFDGAKPEIRLPPPALGEHRDDVRAERTAMQHKD